MLNESFSFILRVEVYIALSHFIYMITRLITNHHTLIAAPFSDNDQMNKLFHIKMI